jgi:uncharacterized membrane protein YidH (DUF202 family)
MNDIDLEIAAIEEMIDLQKRKIDLLRIKNNEIYGGAPGTAMSEVGERDSSVSTGSSNKSPLHEMVSTSRTSATMRTTEIARASEKKHIEEKIEKFEELIPDHLGDHPPAAAASEAAKKPVEKQKEQYIDALTRFSRLSTDLANERTLLAWIRTGLAASRTVCAFMGVEYLSTFGDISQRIVYIGMAITAIVMISQGLERYRKIKWILTLPNPPIEFDRLSVVPAHVALIGMLIIVLVNAAAVQWK